MDSGAKVFENHWLTYANKQMKMCWKYIIIGYNTRNIWNKNASLAAQA